ncbi:MAG: metal-dependent hydrolase [Cyclobacteriaceae bacterium]|nr:metal-dependent hydrolase [Cyclobacteriaceae bacterium]
MASVFGHALTAVALGSSFKKSLLNWKSWTLGIICSILPDADVLGFKLGITYASFWGHRGFTHSLLFALLLGITVMVFFYQKRTSTIEKILLTSYFALSTAFHGILDALTNGGLGVAFFAPWDNTRYFFPWRPIKVSPIGIESFFSEWGLKVLMSEAIWIGIPCLSAIIISILLKNKVHNR